LYVLSFIKVISPLRDHFVDLTVEPGCQYFNVVVLIKNRIIYNIFAKYIK